MKLVAVALGVAVVAAVAPSPRTSSATAPSTGVGETRPGTASDHPAMRALNPSTHQVILELP